ncbi:MAG TPA: M3 family metallopeptidase, partial [Methanomassiliicoccales archaeon]|nr:M3 family metallopeptidase [Methanomassiliicoccales archaeon]
ADIARMFEESDALSMEMEGPSLYCQLRFSANTTDQVANQLYTAMIGARTKIGQSLAFMDIELGRLLMSRPELVHSVQLKDYRHYLERQLKAAPHLLSENEEKLIMAKDKNGVIGWSKLQSSWLSTRNFKIKKDGEEKVLSFGEIASFHSEPDRQYRQEAYKVIGEVMVQDEIVYAEALKAIWNDHLEMCAMRKYDSPMASSLIFNDVDQEIIDALMATVDKNRELFLKYYRVKAKLLGFDRLAIWDILAPLPTTVDKKCTWEESRRIVTDTYRSFDPKWAEWVNEMFELNHLDGEVRKGKRAGAFCSDWMGGKGAYILQSFNGRLSDVNTQAHELGHAIHAYLYTRAQRPCNTQISYCVAECGSTFGELLLGEQLLKEAKSKEEKRQVLVSMMDHFSYVVSNVAIRYHFEQSVYESIKKGENLDAAALSTIWGAAKDRIYGDEVENLPESKMDWARIPHHFMSGLRFYNYPYIFAQLFVFALYRLHKEQGKDFVPKMNALLAAGSSLSARELGQIMGFDISRQEFWQKGFDQGEEFMAQLNTYI